MSEMQRSGAIGVLGLVLAAAGLARAEPCRLELEHTAIVAAVRARPVDPQPQAVAAAQRAEAPLWERLPYQPECLPLVSRWLGDEDESRRVAAAAWMWQHHVLLRDRTVKIPIVYDLLGVGKIPFSTGTWRELPVGPEVRRRWLELAPRERHPIVVRLELAYLRHAAGGIPDARALVQAAAALLPRDLALADGALTLWTLYDDPPLAAAERDAAFALRHGPLAERARFVLSRARDPRWVSELTELLAAPGASGKDQLYPHAAMVGLAPRFAPRVLAEARALVAKEPDRCFFHRRIASQLRGAADETLALATIFLGCTKRLAEPWGELVESLRYGPAPDEALLRLARLQYERGAPPFADYVRELAGALARIKTARAADAVVAIARLAATPRGDDGPGLSRVASDCVQALRANGSDRAAEARLELARILAAGPCERDGAGCLWRQRRELREGIKAQGGAEARRRLRAFDRLRDRPAPKAPRR